VEGYRFFFYSADVNVAINLGYSARELKEIIGATRDHRDAFMEAWNDYFGA